MLSKKGKQLSPKYNPFLEFREVAFESKKAHMTIIETCQFFGLISGLLLFSDAELKLGWIHTANANRLQNLLF